MAIEKINISLDFGTSKQEIGTLITQNQRIYFRYAPSFLDSPLEISPFKLKKTSEIITCPLIKYSMKRVNWKFSFQITSLYQQRQIKIQINKFVYGGFECIDVTKRLFSKQAIYGMILNSITLKLEMVVYGLPTQFATIMG